jgi:hypothetical protein
MRIIFSILFFAFLGFSEINFATELTEERVADLIKSMSVEEKVAQMFMVEIGSITPEEVEKFNVSAYAKSERTRDGKSLRRICGERRKTKTGRKEGEKKPKGNTAGTRARRRVEDRHSFQRTNR